MIKKRTIGLGLALLAVMAVLTVVVWTGQGQQNQAQAAGAELSATLNDDWSVDLSMQSPTQPIWYYQVGSSGPCNMAPSNDFTIQAYQPGEYTVSAYRHYQCYGRFASTTFTISDVTFDATQDEWKVDLELTDGPNPWYFRFGAGGCVTISGTNEVNGISGYTPNTYTIRAYSDSACAHQIASDSVTIPNASLDATRDGWKIDLELTDGPNPWYFRLSGGTCTQVSGTELNGISGYHVEHVQRCRLLRQRVQPSRLPPTPSPFPTPAWTPPATGGTLTWH